MVVNLNGNTQSLLQAGQNRKNIQSAFTQKNLPTFKGQSLDSEQLVEQYKEQLDILTPSKPTYKPALQPIKAVWEGAIKPLEDTIAFLKDKPIPFVATGAMLLAAFSFVPLAASVVCGAFGLYSIKEGIDNSIKAYKSVKNDDNDTANKEISRASTGFTTGILSLLPAVWGVNEVKHTHRAIKAAEQGMEYIKSATVATEVANTTQAPITLTKAQKALAYLQLRNDFSSLQALSELKTPTDYVLAITRYHKPPQAKSEEIARDPNMSIEGQQIEDIALKAVKTMQNPVDAAAATLKTEVARVSGKVGSADVAANEKVED